MRETLDKINAAIGGIVSLLISENYFNFYFSSHKSSSLGGHFRPSKMLESAKTRPTTIIKKANTFFVLERYSWRRGSSALGGCSLSPNLSTSHWTDAFTVKAHGSSVRWERRLPAFSPSHHLSYRYWQTEAYLYVRSEAFEAAGFWTYQVCFMHFLLQSSIIDYVTGSGDFLAFRDKIHRLLLGEAVCHSSWINWFLKIGDTFKPLVFVGLMQIRTFLYIAT